MLQAKMTRRDLLYATGRRAARLNGRTAARAWRTLSLQLIDLGETDLPKFKHLLAAIRNATIIARGNNRIPPVPHGTPDV